MTSGGGARTTLPTVHRDEVDGVPVFWVDSGRPTLAAALVFRCGIVDETLPTTGWTHLVEHLALHGRERGTLSLNGSTSLLHTQFQAHGEAGDVLAFLRDLTGWLATPDLGRVAEESRVLRAEAEYRGTSDAAAAVLQRYGARGAGLAGYTEPGLARATAAEVAGFVRGRFVSGNAALVLDGPPPAGLSLRLPAGGGAWPVPDPPTVSDPRPAAYVTHDRLVLSGEVPRSDAATFLPHVLQDMLRRDLREAAGGAYAPWSSYEAVGPDTAVVLAGSDVARDLLPTVVHYATSGLAALRERGPIEGVVEDAVRAAVQSMRDPYQATGFAFRAARSHLAGEAVQTPELLVEEAAAVTREDVHALVRRFGDSLLLGVPADATWKTELPMLRMPQRESSPTGDRFRSRSFPAVRASLVVGPDGLAVGSRRAWQTLALDEVAGVMAFPDGARQVIAADGWGLAIEPTLWSGGARAVQRLDAAVDPACVIPVPARDPSRVPSPLAWWRRWSPARNPYLAAICWIIAGIVALPTVLALHFVGLFFAGVCFYRAYGAWTAAREAPS